MSNILNRIPSAALVAAIWAVSVGFQPIAAQVRAPSDSARRAADQRRVQQGSVSSTGMLLREGRIAAYGDVTVTPSTVAQPDSVAWVRMVRADTAARLERRRADSTARSDALMSVRRPRSGFYWGIAGGVSEPTGSFRSQYGGGWNVTVPVGWDPAASPLGLRVDGSYDRVTGGWVGRTPLADVAIWSLTADAKLRRTFTPSGSLRSVYVIGGGGAHRILARSGLSAATAASRNGYHMSFAGAPTRWGWNAGAGMSFDWRRSTLFLESRFISVSADRQAGDAHFVPVILGFTF